MRRAGELILLSVHQTDECCSMERIGEAVSLYEALIDDWISG